MYVLPHIFNVLYPIHSLTIEQSNMVGTGTIHYGWRHL